MSSSQAQPKIIVRVYPSEMRYIKPLEIIADYIRRKSGSERISRHHVARIFNPLEELMAEISGKADTIAKILDLFGRHYGFASEDERNSVKKAVVELVDYIVGQRVSNPVRAFKMLRNMRILLIGMATGLLSSITFEVFEKKS